MTADARQRRRWWLRLRLWARRVRLTRRLAYVLAAAAVASGMATLATLMGSSAEDVDPRTIILLLYLDIVLTLLLVAVIARRAVTLWAERRRGLAGSGLHTRLVLVFSLLAATPAVLVAIFAAMFLNFGVHAWFSERVRTAIEESRQVATAYLEEHRKSIQADILAMANDVNREAPQLTRNEWVFNRFLSAQASVRNLPEAIVIDGTGNIIARSDFSFSLQFDIIPAQVLQQAESGEVVTLTSPKDDRVRAIVHLDRFVDAYLVVGRTIEADVLEHITRTEGAVTQFQRVERERDSFQITFVMIFVVVAILLMLAAIWIGLTFANQLARPISGLIGAAERVRKGELNVRVEGATNIDELRLLSRSFNRMTSQLAAQRQGLIDANQELDDRRRFIEAVLEGVSAGVVGLDSAGRISVANASASALLNWDLQAVAGSLLATVIPELEGLLSAAFARPERQHHTEIRLVHEGLPKTLHARVAAEHSGEGVAGYVVTFDDVTELLAAQRKAAWADIARRIAHEIKNPLTPIQLSAERLRRKYGGEITSDPDTFTNCTDTIIRHVGDIGRMVDEFSAFARMPQPSLRPEDLGKICRQAVFLEQNRNPSYQIALDLPDGRLPLRCDAQQVGRALVNVLKNAAESIGARIERDGAGGAPGHISLTVTETLGEDGRVLQVVIDDNGIGLPTELRDRLTEPYVTTRPKGTGLGLAIVKKIMEDHDGGLVLSDRSGGGARVTLSFYHQNVGPEAETPEPEEPVDPMTVATSMRIHG